MPLTASKGEEYPKAPAGTHLGICYMVLDLGIQKTNFEGKEGVSHKCFIGWELPDEKMDDDRPFVISKEYSVSLSPKANLYNDLVSWRGKAFTPQELEGFDIFTVLGAPAMVTVIHKENNKGEMKARLGSVAKKMKGMEAPPPYNPLVKFSFEDGGSIPEDIYDWLKKKIDERLADNWDQYNDGEDKQEGEQDIAIDDDVPF